MARTTALLAVLLIVLQGIGTAQSDTGTITGTLQTDSGLSPKGVRMAAVAVSGGDSRGTAGELLSIAETDESGRYVLENVPPGKYVIIAGSIASPTYYPGTIESSKANLVSVVTGITLRDISFKIGADSLNSARRAREPAARSGFSFPGQPQPAAHAVAGKVQIEGGPASAAFGMVIVAKRSDGLSVDSIVKADGSFQLRLQDGSYVFSTLLLPLGYSLTSVVAGPSDLTNGKPLDLQATSPVVSIQISLKRP
jgi:hypothetical protein